MAEIVFDVDLSGFLAFKREDVIDGLAPYVKGALGVIKGAVRELTPDGSSGLLRRSIVYQFDTAPIDPIAKVYVVGKAGQYAPFVEYGRLPGKMPPWREGTPLYNWVKRKLTSSLYAKTKKVVRIVPNKAKKSTPGAKSVTLEATEILNTSFVIARHIARHGTYSKKGAPHMFELGWEETKDQAMSILESGVTNVLAKLSSK
jgi:hypothetical protein